MITQKLRRVGNSYVVTIPKEEAERQGLQEGDLIGVEVRKLHITPEMPPEVRAAFERSLKVYAADYDYLADR
jgi:putative addiction module antidote